MLIEMGVAYCVHDDCEGTLDDFKAQTLITQACTEEYLVQISDLYSAHEMWNVLLDVFRTRAQGKLLSLHHEARMLTMHPCCRLWQQALRWTNSSEMSRNVETKKIEDHALL
jgi:hypothetical protein